MAILTGAMPATRNIAERVVQIRDLYTQSLAGVFTFVSEANNTITYTMPYTTRKMGIEGTTGYGLRFFLRNLADTGNITASIWNSNIGYNTDLSYTLVKTQTGSGVLRMSDGSRTAISLWGAASKVPISPSSSESVGRGICTAFGNNAFGLYPNADGPNVSVDATLGLMTNFGVGYSRKTIASETTKEIFLPVFVQDNTNLGFLEYPILDLYWCGNVSTIDANSVFSVGMQQFYMIYTTGNKGLCIRV